MPKNLLDEFDFSGNKEKLSEDNVYQVLTSKVRGLGLPENEITKELSKVYSKTGMSLDQIEAVTNSIRSMDEKMEEASGEDFNKQVFEAAGVENAEQLNEMVDIVNQGFGAKINPVDLGPSTANFVRGAYDNMAKMLEQGKEGIPMEGGGTFMPGDGGEPKEGAPQKQFKPELSVEYLGKRYGIHNPEDPEEVRDFANIMVERVGFGDKAPKVRLIEVAPAAKSLLAKVNHNIDGMKMFDGDDPHATLDSVWKKQQHEPVV